MLLVVVRERHSDQDEQRHNGKHHHAQHRQGEQGHIELLVQVHRDVLPEVVGLFASGLLRLQSVVALHHQHSRSDQRYNDHQRDHAEQQDGKRVVVVVDLIL